MGCMKKRNERHFFKADEFKCRTQKNIEKVSSSSKKMAPHKWDIGTCGRVRAGEIKR